MNRNIPITIFIVTIMIMNLVNIANNIVRLQSQNFYLVAYTYTNQAGSTSIYPGSRNVNIVVDVRYNATPTAVVISGCIELPRGFSITRGYSYCSPPYNLNGSTIDIVRYGDIVEFKYRIDIDSSVSPGTYVLNITISYRLNENVFRDKLSIDITVSRYPEPNILVIDNYWNPSAYPGSEGVYLYLILKNNGTATIINANGVAEFQSSDFIPQQYRFSFSNLGKGSTTTIVIGGISISPTASSQQQYQLLLNLNLTLSTDDNVIYYATWSKYIFVRISSPPPVNIMILDYGAETPRFVSGVKMTRLYMTIQNRDFKNIRSMIATFEIMSMGATFINNSVRSISVVQQPLGYGNSATITSDYVSITSIDRIVVKVLLTIFGDDNGAEFWSTQIYTLTIPISLPSISLNISKAFWTQNEVYPGSQNIGLSVALTNLDIVSIRSATAILEMSENFYPKTIAVSGINIPRGDTYTVTFNGISISNQTLPGPYIFKIRVIGTAYSQDGSFYPIDIQLSFSISVSPIPMKNIVRIIDFGWTSQRAYSGMTNTGIYIYFRVSEPGFYVQNPKITLHLPNQLLFETNNRTSTVVLTGVYRYGETFVAEFSGIDIPDNIYGEYNVVVEINALCTGSASYWCNQLFVIPIKIFLPKLNISIIDIGWQSLTSTEATGASIYVTIQSLSIDQIRNMYISIQLDGICSRFIDNRTMKLATLNRVLNYGEITTVTFSDIVVNCNTIKIPIKIEFYSVNSIGSSTYYRSSMLFNTTIKVISKMNILRISNLRTLLNMQYSPLIPSARGITIEVSLVNTYNYPIAWISILGLRTDNRIKINDVSGSCLTGVAAGGSCIIDILVDIDENALPGIYNISLQIGYMVRDGNTLSRFEDKIDIPIVIANYSYYKPNIDIIEWHWGLQTPVRVVKGQKNVPLTVTIINNGRYPVRGVWTYIKPMNNNIRVIYNSSYCASVLDIGMSCTATVYVDLERASAGIALFNVTIEYRFTSYGTNIGDSITKIVDLYIDEFAGGEGIEIIDSGWYNNWPVYPETENATFTISIVNRWSFRISGIKLELILPKGFTSKGMHNVSTYIGGPINSLQEFSATFIITVGSVKPGRYNALLIADYVVENGYPNTRIIQKFNVSLLVNDVNNSITLISSEWLGVSPEPTTYGALLVVSIRNNFIPSMNGPLLELYLPKGITYSYTNTSTALVPASNIAPSTLYTQLVQQPTQGNILGYLQAVMGSQTVQQSFSKGMILYFYVKLNLNVNNTGEFMAKGYLNFIDHWGCIRRIALDIPIRVFGSSSIVEILSPTTIRIENGTSILVLRLRNRGSAPIYNVYISLAPYVSMLVPQQNVIYVDRIYPNIYYNASFLLVYNPYSISMGTTATYLRYMSVPFIVAIAYKDVLGTLRYFNTSIAVNIEPFVDLRIEGLKAIYSGNRLVVSGTIVNYGIATARSVEARVLIDGSYTSTLVGDIDSASQSAFRLEITTSYVQRCKLVIIYRDEYNIERSIIKPVEITISETITTTIAETSQQQSLNHYIITGLVALFLFVVGFILYRYIRLYMKRLEKSIEI